MLRVLTFEGTDQGKARFRFLFAAVLGGPTAIDPDGPQARQRSWAEQREDGRITRLFKRISDESVLPVNGNEVRVRALKPEGGEIALTASQFDAIKKWWARMQWPTYDIDDIDDCYEWFLGAPER